MSVIEIWGPNIWFFLHGLAEKINQEKFFHIKPNIIEIIKIVCLNLPCPECSKDATSILNKTNFNTLNNKEDLKKFIFNFHNHVNKKIGNPIFLYENLDEKYSKINIFVAFKNLTYIFNKNSNNPKLMQNAMIRQHSIPKLNTLFNSLIPYFTN